MSERIAYLMMPAFNENFAEILQNFFTVLFFYEILSILLGLVAGITEINERQSIVFYQNHYYRRIYGTEEDG
jgi:hypothetical protein